VVGVNTDASVRELKGRRRPLIPESERAEMLAHLATVDFVTLFGEATADALIELVRPSVYVKGGDVVLERVPEAPTVCRLGGQIRIAKRVDEHSTSDIIERVLRAYDAADAG
jgi:D-beta-D-heptose 7-phosphate kinase/D-beta-D-heptose 1-phosphate adenosyltransferase